MSIKNLDRFLHKLNGRQDVILAVVLILAVFMIILPLPTFIVDILIAVNLMVSLLLLMIAIYVREPLEFSVFPSILLITTLYRLSLSISTTRLILLQHDAGEIVYTFGNFVVGGNIGIGLIIFTIITIVQFIVITKGSERVAEVGARFSLDGMPGKQMSIDGDMRAGIIDASEANRRRQMVQKESQLYGAMDGAMKFVKGDAIASIIIILVNIFGGIAVGMFVHNMSAGVAVETYSVLSIGDGLIAQIPALLISITAGIIVTRVPGEKRQNLGKDLTEQIARHSNPLFLAAVMLMLFAMLPGFPTLIFLSLSLLVGGAGWMLFMKRKTVEHNGHLNDKDGSGDTISPGSIPVILRLPEHLVCPGLDTMLTSFKWRMFERLGIIVPDVIVKRLSANEPLSIELYQETVFIASIASEDVIEEGGTVTDDNATRLHAGKYIKIYHADSIPDPESHNIITGSQRIIYCLESLLLFHAKEFIGVQETRVLMDGLEQEYSELVKEVQRQMPIAKVTEVLQRLVEERISIRDLRTIFEALLIWAPKEKDIVMLVEYIRTALRRHIIGRYQHPVEGMKVWLIGAALESTVRESIRQTSSGAYSTLESEQIIRILDEIRTTVGSNIDGILLTAIDIRRYLRRLIEKEFSNLSVLSFQELGDEIEINILGNIDLIGDGR